MRLICATMQSQLSTDKYNDMRTLLDYAFSTYKSYTNCPAARSPHSWLWRAAGRALAPLLWPTPG